MVSAALTRPETVGWSGTEWRKLSKINLKASMVVTSLFLMYSGSRLKSLAPLTPSDPSLAFLTLAAADLVTGLGTA